MIGLPGAYYHPMEFLFTLHTSSSCLSKHVNELITKKVLVIYAHKGFKEKIAVVHALSVNQSHGTSIAAVL